MHDALLLVAALLSSVAGMGWFALAMKTHWQQVQVETFPTPAAVRGLRVLGVLALALSLLLCLRADHVSMAVLVWIMALAASALTVALILTWRPQWLGLLLLWTRPRAAHAQAE